MKVLFDTNVVLDVVLDRQPFRDVAAELLARVERKELAGFVGATTITTFYYLVARASSQQVARSAVRDLIGLFQVAPVDREVLSLAAASSMKDFEDAVLCEAGALAGADAVVTRNPQDFQGSRLKVFSPQALQTLLS
ncbi:MAG: type II toxin-antitoxin system VapC family toxin [Thermoanaerobaculia bacterium]